MKRRQLESFLQSLETFEHPRLDLEQYATGASLGADILHAINSEHNFDGTIVADLGCGCGVLLLGAIQMGAELATGFDIDDAALRICSENIRENDLASHADLIQTDIVRDMYSGSRFDDTFDIIVMNPPFGTKNNTGVDLRFVECGLRLLRSGGNLFSLHKSSTRAHILRRTKNDSLWCQFIADVSCVAELQWNLKKTYRHQRRETVDIAVDLFKFTKR